MIKLTKTEKKFVDLAKTIQDVVGVHVEGEFVSSVTGHGRIRGLKRITIWNLMSKGIVTSAGNGNFIVA